MVIPIQLTIHDAAYCLDGGTTLLRGSDENGCNRSIKLVQHARPQRNRSDDEIPGRLYFDGELVPMRSQDEVTLLALLRDHGQGTDSRDILPAMIERVICFVESEEYLRIAERVEQAADPARYTVWVTWEPDSRKQVIVRLAGMLGIGVRAAREMLERGAPLAEGVSALKVTELGRRYTSEGLTIRVEPAFRWPLA